jgi:hypothetical protein
MIQRSAWLKVPIAAIDYKRAEQELTISNPAYWELVNNRKPIPEGMQPELALYQWEEGYRYIHVPRNYSVPWTDRGLKMLTESEGPLRVGKPLAKVRERVEHVITLRDRVQEEASLSLQQERVDKILSLACGKGKGLPNRARVLTPQGWKRVDSIEVGDHFIGSNGKSTLVIGVYPQGERPCYRVTFSDGSYVNCDDQHLWQFRVDNRRDEVISTKDLHNTPLRTKAGRRFALDLVAPVEFREQPSLPIDPWVFGMFLGDGNARSGIITNPEKDLQDRILSTEGGRLLTPDDRCEGIQLSHTGFVEAIRELGFTDGTLSDSKFIPRRFLRASIKDRIKLLQGLFDSDGFVSQGNTIEYSSTSRKLIKNIIELVRSLGGLVNHHPEVKVPTYQRSEGKLAYRIWARFPRQDFVPVSSKKHLAKWHGEYQRKRKYVVSVECLEKEETTCFKVTAEDSLFVAEGYNLTHNTVCALHAAAMKQLFPCLIICHTNALVDQWKDAIGGDGRKKQDGTIHNGFYRQANGLHIRDRIGHIQRNVQEWKGLPIAVGMLHTLVQREFSEEFYRYWRLIIIDETHRIGAQSFLKVASLFPAERWGLTATLEREDRMDRVIQLHMGKVVYKDLVQPLKPTVVFVRSRQGFSEPRLRSGRVNMAQLMNVVSARESRNEQIAQWIEKSASHGRTVLVLGERIQQLTTLSVRCSVKSKAIHIGAMDAEKRKVALTKQVVFATQHIAKEGLDRPQFDTLFILFPFAGEGRLRQSIGRILRIVDGKKKPLVFIFEDDCGILRHLCNKMRGHLAGMQFEVMNVDSVVEEKANQGLLTSERLDHVRRSSVEGLCAL